MLEESQRAVVFTGAGISTESGIPDFQCEAENNVNSVSKLRLAPV